MRGVSAARGAFVLLALLVVPLLAAGVGVEALTEQTYPVVERRLVHYALAVGERSDGTAFGVAPPLEVTMRTGSGRVLVETEPLTEIDMQGSARLAVSVAASIAGFDSSGWDFLFFMSSPSPVVGGPSAGGVMATAAVALMRSWDLASDVAMTGMINPDGTIGPVGGILEKLAAAADEGARVFLVPPGQTVVTRSVQEVRSSGAFQQVVTRQEQVDVVAEGARRGVEVREAADLYEAVERFTGWRIERRVATGNVTSEAYTAVMGPAAEEQLREARKFLEGVRAQAVNASLSPSLARQVDGLLAEGDERLARATERDAAGSYYSASSLVFQSRLKVRLAEYLVRAGDATDAAAEFEALAASLEGDVPPVSDAARDRAAETLSGLSALGAAQDRALEAAALLEEARSLAQGGSLASALDRLAFARERLLTARWWLDLSETLDDSGLGGRAWNGSVDDLSRQSLSAAVQALTYAALIVSESGVGGTPAEIVSEGQADLDRAQEALAEGFQEAAIFLSLEAQVAGFTALSLVGADADLSDRLDEARNRALLEVADARAAGVEPVVAVSLLDFGDTLATEAPTRALLFYAQAATVARAGILFAGAPFGAPRATFVGPGLFDRFDLPVVLALVAGALLAGVAGGAALAGRSRARPGPETGAIALTPRRRLAISARRHPGVPARGRTAAGWRRRLPPRRAWGHGRALGSPPKGR